MTGVSGSVEPLAALTGLTGLYLADTDVHGDATVIRNAVPGLSGWGSSDENSAEYVQYHFTACDTVTCTSGSPRADPASYVGSTVEACCP